jgi:very-long-chain ceramide synthase
MLPSYVAPFFSLQYPTATPAHPDSFPHSTYYNTGKLDICILISYIAIMAVLRDAFRLGIFEPLARWKLLRDLELTRKKKVLNKVNGSANDDTNDHHHIANGNGNANGKGLANANGQANGSSRVVLSSGKKLRQINRSVLRFAEQGWSVVYYSLQLSFGIVRNFPSFFFFSIKKKLSFGMIMLSSILIVCPCQSSDSYF